MRRDEAEAQAREEEQEKRTQIVDSERRLKLLRGHRLDDLPVDGESPSNPSRKDNYGRSRKRRRLAGEDDTDRDMRLAKEEAALDARPSDTSRTTNEPLTDPHGHINLFPPKSRQEGKNVEAEAELAKKKREYEDQYTMRFSNAAGFKQGLSAPWYSTVGEKDAEALDKDVWGNDDIRRREREKNRTDANDPLVAIKRGVKQFREKEKSRNEWVAKRKRELRELEALESSRRIGTTHRKRRRRRNDSEELEGFNLDDISQDHKKGHHHRRRRSNEDHSDHGKGRQHVPHQGRQHRSCIT